MVNRVPAIRTEGLTKNYGALTALVDVSLEVELGEIYGFLGPNGSGKTTLIRTLLDEIRPTAGRAAILGLDTRSHPVAIRRRVGYLPGDLSLYPKLTGRETLEFLANLRGGVDWDHVHDLSDRLGANLSKRVGTLSTGNRQKIGLIQALMSRPQVVIMDEPSVGLDPLVQRELQAIMREFAAQGGAVFLSSHTLSEVQRVADRVAIIRNGALVAVEGLTDLRSKAVRRVDLDLADTVDPGLFRGLAGVREVAVDGHRVTLAFEGPVNRLLDRVSAHTEIIDIATREADLEEVFLAYYRGSPTTRPTAASSGTGPR